MTLLTPTVKQKWQELESVLSVTSAEEYDRAIEHIDELLDEVGTDESHPLYMMLDTLGTLIHAYEEENEVLPEASGAEALAFLMDEHDLRQSDLPEIGSQGVVSEVLSGKRELNVRQIRALCERFSVPASVFI